MFRLLLVSALLSFTASPSAAAVVWRSYQYFTVGGSTLDALMLELSTRGPHVSSTGQRHPGATKLQFNTRLGYLEKDGWCRISEAAVTIKARITLPRWKGRAKASRELRIYWDALSADIKRHEEGHVVIAKNFGRDLEQELTRLPRSRACDALAANAEELISETLDKYYRASERFDRIEGASFDRRMEALYNYRLERIEAGILPEP